MRYVLIISFLLSMNLSLFSQNLFKTGVEYFEKGKYFSADSIFSILMEKPPVDRNVLFNYGTTRLYLRDTCKFCDVMLKLCHSYQESDACDLYFNLCGTIDTLYFDKNNLACEKKNARYSEMIETHKNEDFKTVYVHDKRKKDASVILNTDLEVIKTDIVAVYTSINNSKIFLFTTTPPTFKGGKEAYDEYLDKNPYIKEGKKKLNLNKVEVGVEYVVGKMGNIGDIQITDISKPSKEVENKREITLIDKDTKIDNLVELKQYVDLFIYGMPQRIPGKYRDENIDYLVKSTVVFW